MNSDSDRVRFELLDAGRALGDLSPEEEREWQKLAEERQTKADPAFDWIVASLESELAARRGPDSLPPALASRLRDGMKPFIEKGGETQAGEKVVVMKRFPRAAAIGWALAACLGLLLVIEPGSREVNIAAQRVALVERDGESGLVFEQFSGSKGYEQLNGDVVWSDSDQAGYMRLTNLKANNPSVAQYQLWIVDPGRDDKPVDGGVFDMPADQSEAIISIDAKLIVNGPKAFVITLEKPGGVVVSKQETVVGIAQAG